MQRITKSRIAAMLATAVLATVAVNASAQAGAAQPLGKAFVQVTESTLSGVRGGFSGGNGLEVTFGIERSIVVGGAIASATTFNIVSTGVAGGLAGSVPAIISVVQNAIDGQKIQAVTTLNITANSVQVLKQANVQTLLGGAVAASLIR